MGKGGHGHQAGPRSSCSNSCSRIWNVRVRHLRLHSPRWRTHSFWWPKLGRCVPSVKMCSLGRRTSGCSRGMCGRQEGSSRDGVGAESWQRFILSSACSSLVCLWTEELPESLSPAAGVDCLYSVLYLSQDSPPCSITQALWAFLDTWPSSLSAHSVGPGPWLLSTLPTTL